jgi:carbon starvation protein
LFGTSNQLLAGLSLLAITVWLRRAGKRHWYTLYPALFVLTITLWSLVLQIQAALRGTGAIAVMNGAVALALALLAVTLLTFSVRVLRGGGAGARDPV